MILGKVRELPHRYPLHRKVRGCEREFFRFYDLLCRGKGSSFFHLSWEIGILFSMIHIGEEWKARKRRAAENQWGLFGVDFRDPPVSLGSRYSGCQWPYSRVSFAKLQKSPCVFKSRRKAFMPPFYKWVYWGSETLSTEDLGHTADKRQRWVVALFWRPCSFCSVVKLSK